MVDDKLLLWAEGKLLVGEKLKEYKEKHDMSSVALAKQLGISEAYLSQVLSGKRLGMRKVVDFAQKLGVTVDYLTGRQVFLDIRGVLKAGGVVDFQRPSDKKLEITNLPELSLSKVKSMYALRVEGDLLPFAKKGDILIIQEKFDGIGYGDKFISWEDDAPRVRYVQGLDQSHVVLACILNIAPARILERKSGDLPLHKIIYHLYA